MSIDNKCGGFRTMRLKPYSINPLRWRGVDCNGEVRYFHGTYRDTPETAVGDRAGEDRALKTRGPSSLGPAVPGPQGIQRGNLYRDGNEGIRARALTWCDACEPQCIQGCSGLDTPIGSREDITVQPTLEVTVTFGDGTCCAGSYGKTFRMCPNDGCSLSIFTPLPTFDSSCHDVVCDSEDGWVCNLMGTWIPDCYIGDPQEVNCKVDAIGGEEPTYMSIFGQIDSYCCYRVNEDGQPECCNYLYIALHVSANGSDFWPLACGTEEAPNIPGCCTNTDYPNGCPPGTSGYDYSEGWDQGLLYANKIQIAGASPPASERVCGAFSVEGSLNINDCGSICSGLAVSIEGAEE